MLLRQWRTKGTPSLLNQGRGRTKDNQYNSNNLRETKGELLHRSSGGGEVLIMTYARQQKAAHAFQAGNTLQWAEDKGTHSHQTKEQTRYMQQTKEPLAIRLVFGKIHNEKLFPATARNYFRQLREIISGNYLDSKNISIFIPISILQHHFKETKF